MGIGYIHFLQSKYYPPTISFIAEKVWWSKLAEERELTKMITVEFENVQESPTDLDLMVDVDNFKESLSGLEVCTLELHNQGYTHQEIADKLGCARTTVTSRLNRLEKKWETFYND